jgi:hypothetical protein
MVAEDRSASHLRKPAPINPATSQSTFALAAGACISGTGTVHAVTRARVLPVMPFRPMS